MPVALNIKMLFLVNTLKPSHPSHAVVTAPHGPRRMRATLHLKYASSIDQHMSNDSTFLKNIHTSAVAASINRLGVNPLLGTRPPSVFPPRQRLSRPQRTTLSPLRSGHYQLLQDYRVRVGQATSDVCPACNSQPHTVSHLFDCTAAPTSRSVRDLWLNPVSVCNFLSSGLPSVLLLSPISGNASSSSSSPPP